MGGGRSSGGVNRASTFEASATCSRPWASNSVKEKEALRSNGSYGRIARPKIVLRASPLFLFISFSFWIIFIIMGEPNPNAYTG